MGEFAGTERPQRLGSPWRAAVAEPDPDHEFFAVAFVGDADDLGVENVQVGAEELLDLAWVDVLAPRMTVSLVRPVIWR